jgi:Transglutaminase-like superfamily/TgpA N-terminal domain
VEKDLQAMNGSPTDRHELLNPWQNRVFASAAAVTMVALTTQQTTRVFSSEYNELPTVLMVGCAGVALMLVSTRAWPLRAAVAALTWLGGTVGGVLAANGVLPGDATRAVTLGLGDLVATAWPSPPLAAGVGAITGLCCLCSALASEFAARRSAPLAMIPAIAVVVLVAMLSAGGGAPSTWFVACFTAAALVLCRADSPQPSRFSALLAGGVGAAVVVVSLAAGSIFDEARFDPRDHIEPPALPDLGVSPLARIDEWRSRDPVTEMFRTDRGEATRWRLVGLSRYDGQSWLPADDFRLAGRQIGQRTDDPPSATVTVRLDRLDSVWIPTMDRIVTVSTDVRVDSGASALLLDVAPEAGFTYQLGIEPDVADASELAAARATRSPSVVAEGFEIPTSILQLATTATAGATTDFERASRLAAFLHDNFILDASTPPGHTIAEIRLFLEGAKRGREEQFVAAYGLLADAVGLPVRVAVGFETVSDGSGGTVALSDRASAWPEVQFEGIGWVPFDPVPGSQDSEQPALGTGGVAPIDDGAVPPMPPTTADTATVEPTAPPPPSVEAAASTAATTIWAGIGIGLGIVCLFGTYAVAVLAEKRRRRRLRRLAPIANQAAVGAFITAIDTWVDLGGSASSAATDHELAMAARSQLGKAGAEIEYLATTATSAVYSNTPMSSAVVDNAWRHLELFERGVALGVGTWRFLRSRLRLRSLRRGLKP